jgi:hypothetical protein
LRKEWRFSQAYVAGSPFYTFVIYGEHTLIKAIRAAALLHTSNIERDFT